MDGWTSEQNTAERKFSELEDFSEEIIQNATYKDYEMKKNEREVVTWD